MRTFHIRFASLAHPCNIVRAPALFATHVHPRPFSRIDSPACPSHPSRGPGLAARDWPVNLAASAVVAAAGLGLLGMGVTWRFRSENALSAIPITLV